MDRLTRQNVSTTKSRIHLCRYGVTLTAVFCFFRDVAADGEAMTIQAKTETYRTAGDRGYRLHLFVPDGAAGSVRAGIVFFHGWGKSLGPEQFFPQCRYFATRGMVAGSAEYRVLKDDSPEYRALTLENSRAAVGWLRSNAAQFQLDPNRLAAAGGSGGGWAAAATAMIAESTEEETTASSSASVPDALILFNPVFRFRKTPGLSPADHVRPGLPPMIIFHGEEDQLIPVESVRQFCEEMSREKNQCKLRTFPGKKHSFFNYGIDQNRPYYETLMMADEFLVRLGFLEGAATLRYEDVKTE